MSYKSVTLIFPGQGSQFVGMGKNIDQELWNKVDKKLGYSISKIALEGPEEDLKLTANTQPAIVTDSIGNYLKVKEILDEKGVTIDQVLGHSVGEYAALAAAGVFTPEDAALAVHYRGKFMQEAVAPGVGKMYAILRAELSDIIDACEKASTENEIVMPANFNDPGQVVISGEANACDRAAKILAEKNARTIQLKVSAPFHCTMMEPAAKNLAKFFNELKFTPNTIPYIANINAQKYEAGTDINIIKENLIAQVVGSVQWLQSFQTLPSDTLCIECGPGKVLAGMARKINKEIKVISLSDEGAFDELRGLL